MFFRTVSDAERSLEATDVRNDEYVAYELDGSELVITTCEVESVGLLTNGHTTMGVSISRSTEVSGNEHKLRELLDIFYCVLTDSSNDLSRVPLCELVDLVFEKVGYS